MTQCSTTSCNNLATNYSDDMENKNESLDKPGNGGDLILNSGIGGHSQDPSIPNGDDGDIILYTGGEEALKICHDGNFYVRGRLIENDKEVYLIFKEWCNNAGIRQLSKA